jgi:hypothetical protein
MLPVSEFKNNEVQIRENGHKTTDEESDPLLGFKMNKRRESQRLMQQKERRKIVRSKPKERHSDSEEAREKERTYKLPGEITSKEDKEVRTRSSKKRKAVEVPNTPVKRRKRVTHRTPKKAEAAELHKNRETIVIDDSPVSSKTKARKHRPTEEDKKDEDYELAKRLQQEEDRKVLPYFVSPRKQDRAYYSDSDYSDSDLPFQEVHTSRRKILTPYRDEEDSEEFSSEDYEFRYDGGDEEEYDDYIMFPDAESEGSEDGWRSSERWDRGRAQQNEVEEKKGEPKQRIVVNLDEDSSVEEKPRNEDRRVDTRASRARSQRRGGTREEKQEGPKVETRSTRRASSEDGQSQERDRSRYRAPTHRHNLPPQPPPRARWGGPPERMFVDEYGRPMAYSGGGGGRGGGGGGGGGFNLFNMLTAQLGYRIAPVPPRNADPLYALQFQDRYDSQFWKTRWWSGAVFQNFGNRTVQQNPIFFKNRRQSLY